MTAIVIEHVPVAELAAAWRAQLTQASGATVTVRIEQDAQTAAPQEIFKTDDSAFGIWRDHEDTADVVAYVRNLREPRYDRRGSRTKASETRSGFPLLPSHSGEPTVTLQLVNQLRDDSV